MELAAYPPGIRNPVYLRIRTTDLLVYEEILLREQYAFDLAFTPKTIVDAGANIGLSAIYFAHKYPGAKIIAIEPEASNFAVLAKNVRPYPGIIPVHAALWNRDGEISVSQPDPSTGATGEWAFITHQGPGTKVRALTIRTLMKEMRMPSIDILKVDIEGAEKEVFEGCDWMDSIRCLMIEMHDRLKAGCREAVDAVTQEFLRLERGEAICYVRPAGLCPACAAKRDHGAGE
jgi:FkbM family methyltransferase